MLGSLRRSKHTPSLHLAATALAALGICMAAFVLSPNFWFSVAAACLAGVACLVANSATRTLLAKEAGPAREARVMAVWAVAWAGSKPLASLMDGSLPSLIGIRATGGPASCSSTNSDSCPALLAQFRTLASTLAR